MLIAALLMTAALGAAPSPGDDPDTVVTTAPATPVDLSATTAPVAPPVSAQAQTADPHGLSTDQQIAQWLAARSPTDTTSGAPDVWRDDRKLHGAVSVGVGTGGYRDYAATMSLPIGESGRLDISVRETANGYPYDYGYAYDQGYDLYGGDRLFISNRYAFPSAHRPGAEFESRSRRSGSSPSAWRDHRAEEAPTQ